MRPCGLKIKSELVMSFCDLVIGVRIESKIRGNEFAYYLIST